MGQIRELKEKYPRVVADIESKRQKKISAGKPKDQVNKQYDPILGIGRRMTLTHKCSEDRGEILVEERDKVGKMPSSNFVVDLE